MSSLYRRYTVWWYRYYDRQDRRHHAEPLRYPDGRPIRNRRDALYFKAKKDQQLLERTHHARDGYLTVATALERYTASSRLRKTPKTLSTEGYRISKLSEVLGGLKLIHLTPRQVESALDTLQVQEQLSAATRNHYLGILKAFGSWCLQQGYMFENPAHPVKKVKEITQPRTWLPREQREQLLQEARAKLPRLYPMIATALLAGLRLGELITLEWSDIDFDQNLLHVRVKETWIPKSKKGRVVPLHPRLREILEPLRQPEGHCFLNQYGRPYMKEPNPELLNRVYEPVGIKAKGRQWHVLRHSFATGLAQEGVSIWKIKEWLGHADVRTTDIYAHLAPSYDPDISRV